MNGNRYFLNTNAIIALLKGNSFIENTLSQAEWIATSIISVIEFLSYSDLSINDKLLLTKLLKRIQLVNISNNIEVLESIAVLKRENKLKLPDAIIARSAIQHNAILLSTDKHFLHIKNLLLLQFE